MPSFTKEVDFDFEVFCGICGEGICDNTTVRKSRERQFPQIVVECPKCQKIHNREVEDLKEEIEYLKSQLNK